MIRYNNLCCLMDGWVCPGCDRNFGCSTCGQEGWLLFKGNRQMDWIHLCDSPGDINSCWKQFEDFEKLTGLQSLSTKDRVAEWLNIRNLNAV